MGVVYKAEDTKLKRPVALKFLSPRVVGGEEERARFLREAQAAAILDHPSICTIHEIEEVGDQTFIAMAYVDGGTLKQRLGSGPMEVRDALGVAIQVAEGLREAHEKGIVHRDIKSSNIMVTARGQVKITDFGLAKLTGRTEITTTGTKMGTVAYASPEQVRGEAVDHQADIWSLGVVLYEMLAGRLPFRSDFGKAVVYFILHEEPAPLSLVRQDVPPEFARIVDRALTKGRQERYRTVGQLLEDLKSVREQIEAGAMTEGRIAQQPRTSIAVLPFANMSGDPDNEYFSDGLAEELINALTHVGDLRVVARTSAFSFKGKDTDIREIGRKLNVATVLEGSVRSAGDRLRITAQLINVADGYHLWSERYDCVMADVFAIQDEVALQIVDKLKVELLGGERARLVERHTDDLKAYELYLKGAYFTARATREDLYKGIEYFSRAVGRDPSYARACAGLAQAHGRLGLYFYVPECEALPRARAAAQRALEINPGLAEAHATLGLVRLLFDWDWDGAETILKHAIDLNPNSSWTLGVGSGYAMVKARFDEAIGLLQRAAGLDPLSVMTIVQLGLWQLRAGRSQLARQQFLKALEVAPDHPYPHWLLGQVHAAESRYDEAIGEIEHADRLSHGFPPIVAALGCAYALSSRTGDAREVLERLSEGVESGEYVRPYLVAKVHAALGEIDRAFEWLEKAYTARDSSLVQLLTDESVDPLRSDPRFDELLRRMDLYRFKTAPPKRER